MTGEEGVRRTLARYCHLLDDGRFDEWGHLFVEDASLVALGRAHHGRDAIQAWITKVQPPEHRGKHICANSLVDVDVDGHGAAAVTDYTFFARAAGGTGFDVVSAGRYYDRLVRGGDGTWRFAERRIVFVGDEP